MTFETTTVDLTGTALTAEIIKEASDHIVARAGLAYTDEVLPAPTLTVETKTETEVDARPVNFGKGRNGFRNVGLKKMGLINKLATTLGGMQAKGINTDYILKKFTNWKGPIATPTKTISGIISQVKEFDQ
jgi:hypothetical protein